MALGAAMSNGTVRVLDSTGKAIATGKPVTAVTGAYGPITLSGTGPYRVEACGNFAGRQRCVWSATNVGGTLHITPLTSALTVLAGGQAADAMMAGTVQGLGDPALATAQTQLRAALAPLLTEAGLAADFDFMTGNLTPASHAGYDLLLDLTDVALNQDGSVPAVRIGSRLGTNTAYLEPGGAAPTPLNLASGAAGFDFTGLDAMAASMITGTANNNVCQASLTPLFDAAGRYNIETVVRTGANAAELLCLRMNGVLGDGEVLFGGKLLQPELDRCDFPSGADPVCRVSFRWLTSKGELRVLGVEQAAVKRPGGWRFLGNRLEVQATATARTRLIRRIDKTAPDNLYRYIDIPIPAASGVQCAVASQKDTNGANAPFAIFKSTGAGTYLSLWSVSLSDGSPSLNAASGVTRGNDIVEVPIANSVGGDSLVRNFVRMGREVRIALYGDIGCSTPWAGADGATISVNMAGTPPLAASSMTALPWPNLVVAGISALSGLKAVANAKISLQSSWTLTRGGLTMTQMMLCTDAACGTRLGLMTLPTAATTATLTGTNGASLLDTVTFKQLRLMAINTDGSLMQTDWQSCGTVAAGVACP